MARIHFEGNYWTCFQAASAKNGNNCGRISVKWQWKAVEVTQVREFMVSTSARQFHQLLLVKENSFRVYQTDSKEHQTLTVTCTERSIPSSVSSKPK